MRIKYFWHKKMKKRPQFSNIILKRSSSKKKSVFGVKSQKDLPSLGFEIFNILGFIKDHVVPFFPSENFLILKGNFIRSYANLEIIKSAPSCSFLFSFFLSTIIGEYFKGWTPFFKFYFPINNNACWYNNEVRTPYSFFNSQIS